MRSFGLLHKDRPRLSTPVLNHQKAGIWMLPVFDESPRCLAFLFDEQFHQSRFAAGAFAPMPRTVYSIAIVPACANSNVPCTVSPA